MTALKHYAAGGSVGGLAQAHCGLAGLYTTAFAEGYNPLRLSDMTKPNEKRVKVRRRRREARGDALPRRRDTSRVSTALGHIPRLEARHMVRGMGTAGPPTPSNAPPPPQIGS